MEDGNRRRLVRARQQAAGFLRRERHQLDPALRRLDEHLVRDREGTVDPGPDDEPGPPGDRLREAEGRVAIAVAQMLRRLLPTSLDAAIGDDDVPVVSPALDL